MDAIFNRKYLKAGYPVGGVFEWMGTVVRVPVRIGQAPSLPFQVPPGPTERAERNCFFKQVKC